MKQILSLTLALALMAALFTGCACSANVSTEPNGMITEQTTRPTVMPMPTATHETTRPTEMTHPTMPHIPGTDPTLDGSRPTDGTAATDSTTETRQGNRNAVR